MFIGKRCKCSSGNKKRFQSGIDLEKLSHNLTLLSVKSRLDILFLLKDKPHCVCDLAAHTKMSQSLISHHLSDLTSADFIGNRREGKYVEHCLTQKGEDLVRTLMVMMIEVEGGEIHNG